MQPNIIKGNCHEDGRGILCFNNSFDMQGVKRMYTIENVDTDLKRGWQGHRVEQRWFSATAGSFKIRLIKIDHWESPDKNLPVQEFILKSETLDVLHIPGGYITSIQSLETESKLLLFADYQLGEIQDEYRFDLHYFN